MWSHQVRFIRHTHTARSMLKWAAAQRVWSRQSWITHNTHKTRPAVTIGFLLFLTKNSSIVSTDLWWSAFETQTLWLVFFPSESARLSCTKKWTTTSQMVCWSVCVPKAARILSNDGGSFLSPSIWMNECRRSAEREIPPVSSDQQPLRHHPMVEEGSR